MTKPANKDHRADRPVLEASINHMLKGLKKEESRKNLASNSGAYQKKRSDLQRCETNLYQQQRELLQLKRSRIELQQKWEEAKIRASSLNLLYRILSSAGRSQHRKAKNHLTNLTRALKENKIKINQLIVDINELRKEVFSKRAERDCALVNCVLKIELEAPYRQKKLNKWYSGCFDEALQKSLTCLIFNQCCRWRENLVTHCDKEGWFERNLSEEELALRKHHLKVRVWKLAGEVCDTARKAGDEKGEAWLNKQMYSLIEDELEGVLEHSNLDEILSNLYGTARRDAQDRVQSDASSELREQHVDTLLSELLSP